MYLRYAAPCFTLRPSPALDRVLRVAVFAIMVTAPAFAQTPAADVRPCVAPKTGANACHPVAVTAQEPSATAFVVQQPASPEEKLSAWAPLFQSVLWVLLLAGFLIGFRKNVAALIDRIKSLDIGPVKFGMQPEPMEPPSTAIPETVPIEIGFE